MSPANAAEDRRSGWSGAEGPGRKIWGPASGGGPPPLVQCAFAADPLYTFTPTAYYYPAGGILGSAQGNVCYASPGGTLPNAPAPLWPFANPWHFPNYQVVNGLAVNPLGWVDNVLGTLANGVRQLFVGQGIITTHTLQAIPGQFDPIHGAGGATTFGWQLFRHEAIGPDTVLASGTGHAGVDFTVTVDQPGCLFYMDLSDIAGGCCSYDGFDWVSTP